MLHRLAFLALAALLALPVRALAQAQAEDLSDLVQVDILPGWRTEEGTHMAGLRIRLAPGWKTYWRAPGDAGIPPQVDWTGSDNLVGAAFHWPVPEVSWPNGMRTIGYSGEVTWPIELDLSDPSAPVRIAGHIQMGICEDVCVPVEMRFDAVLPEAGAGRDPSIVAALVDRPLTAEEAGVRGVTCAIVPTEGGMRVTATLDMPARHQGETVVIESADSAVWVTEPRVRMQGDRLEAVAELLHIDGGPFALDRSGLRFTVLGGQGQAVDIRGCDAG